MTEAEMRGYLTAQQFIENSLFGASPVTEPRPDFEFIAEDVITGLRGTLTVFCDFDEQEAQPDDWRTVTRAMVRYCELDGDEYRRPVRIEWHQLTEGAQRVIQDLADDEVRAME